MKIWEMFMQEQEYKVVMPVCPHQWHYAFGPATVTVKTAGKNLT